ncbi:uncharacterized protein LOC142884579 [Nelusetta ayraudi]|uniref:uncharacterized protein LOC142884579 n=1 Tax=Nelusetta ayraudi TaxID=303726 RepID=UPI003F6FE073
MQTKASYPWTRSPILNMSGLLFLLCCMLTVTWGDKISEITHQPSTTVNQNTSEQASFFPTNASTLVSTPGVTQLTKHISQPTSGQSPKTSAPDDNSRNNFIDTKHCLPVLMLTGGLIIACTILLISTLMLACQVCHLSGRLKALASDEDLVSSSDYWTGKAKRAKGKVETEDKEDSVLLDEIDQKQGDAKEESVTANGDKKKEEEEEKKEEEEEKKEEEKKKEEEGEKKLSVAAEESSSTKPQEDASSSPPAEPEAAATAD